MQQGLGKDVCIPSGGIRERMEEGCTGSREVGKSNSTVKDITF